MRRILIYICIVLALFSCVNKEKYTPTVEGEILVSPMEVGINSSITKTFDDNLVWKWESADKVLSYQVRGSKTVNVLNYVGENRFGTKEYQYSANESSTFHFVYAGDALLDQTTSGDRRISQLSEQSGVLTPVLVGSALNASISDVSSAEKMISMEYLSSALEIRLWKQGVDRSNLTDEDKKNIAYAELFSDTECFLLDVIPTYNLDGTITYNQRERDASEDPGAYIKTDNINGPVVVFNIAPHEEKYEAGALVVAITDENGERYEAPLPAVSFGIGERTIVNVEWVPESVTLPDGPTFNEIVGSFMDGNEITSIKFITGSTTKSENELVENSVFLLKNGDVLEIHTASEHYMANSNCSAMFCSYDGHTSFSLLKSIDFGNSFNTGNVTDISKMFAGCSSLSTLDVSSFDTYNVTNMASMFEGCSSLTSLDVTKIDTQNVTDMSAMFFGCSGLASLDLSSFNTKNVTTMFSMFKGCSALTSLDISHFNTAKVTDMSAMFMECSTLSSLSLGNLNTSSVEYFDGMFKRCRSLASLDLSSFTFESASSIGGMLTDVGVNVESKPVPVYFTEEAVNFIKATEPNILSSETYTICVDFNNKLFECLGVGEWFDNLFLMSSDEDFGIQKVVVYKSDNYYRIMNPYANEEQMAISWGADHLGGDKSSYIEFWVLENGQNVAWDGWWCPGILYDGAGTDIKAYYPSYLNGPTEEDNKSSFYDDKVIGFYPYWKVDGVGGWGVKYPCFLSLPGGPALEDWL